MVLHDHLDGGVRPQTVIELAAARGLELPTTDPTVLAKWFTITPEMPFADAWQRFNVVVAVLQTADGLRRVAREAVEDLAGDGVIYAELRFAPLNHIRGGLRPRKVMEAVAEGLAAGEAQTGCIARTIVCGIRENDPAESAAAAKLAVSCRDIGVVGFDLAGNESDFGANLHTAAFATARDGGLGITVHAGEMAGPDSIATALVAASPTRIGHGLNLVADCEIEGGQIVWLGPTARAVRDYGLVLEVCVTSNSCLGTPVATHPVRMYHDAGIAVTVNPDDRAITTTTVGREYELWRDVHGFTSRDFQEINLRALDAAFCAPSVKAALHPVISAGWA